MSDEEFKPDFLKSEEDRTPNVNNELERAPDQTWGDYMLQSKGWLSPRHREACRLWAMGHKNIEIAKELKVSENWLSTIKSNTRIRQEIERFQDRIFETDLERRMKNMGQDAANVMEEILLDPDLKIKDKESAAKWVLEKVSGKPAQSVDLRGEINIGIFMDQLESMKDNGELLVGSKARDVTPEEIAQTLDEDKEPDPIEDWINCNI